MKSESLVNQFYKLCMGTCIFLVTGTVLIFVLAHFSMENEGDPVSGALFLAVAFFSFAIVTPAALLAACISFVWRDLLPDSKYYSLWLPLLFLLPAIFVLGMLLVEAT